MPINRLSAAEGQFKLRPRRAPQPAHPCRFTGTDLIVLQLMQIEDRRDQQDGIGAMHLGLVNLQLIDDEILAQHRQASPPPAPA